MTAGLIIIAIGAICGGSFGLPAKFAPKGTPWEVLWGPFFFFATILLPLTIGPVLVKDLFGICGTMTVQHWLMPVLFGFLWGLGSMTLGRSFAFIGLSLAYALNYGMQIAFGMLAPSLIFNASVFGKPQGVLILLGAAVCILGVVVSGRAALIKEASQQSTEKTQKKNMPMGIFVAVLSGILCACYAVASGYGSSAMKLAEAANPSSSMSGFIVTALILWGGSLSACGYCVQQLSVNKTWGELATSKQMRVYVIALIMALLHDGAIACYNIGAPMLSKVGNAIGYGIFMSLAIFTGTLNGFIAGEWKGANPRAVNGIRIALVILVAGVCILAYANSL
ncbi:MAG: L-rhamnose/proton symporter RhaT [bacterium]